MNSFVNCCSTDYGVFRKKDPLFSFTVHFAVTDEGYFSTQVVVFVFLKNWFVIKLYMYRVMLLRCFTDNYSHTHAHEL